MTIDEILGADGAIAERLADYEVRPQQLTMAQAVNSAIQQQRHLMVEAGTGVGKSFAYLVPVILHALGNENTTVIVSTHTIGLQEQLIRKDIPFLQTILPSFRAIQVKGRSNYLSRRRLRVAQQRAGSLFSEQSTSDQLLQIGRWSRKTTEGSRTDLDFYPSPVVWGAVESDSGNCLGRDCKDFNQCFYFKARRGISNAHLLIVNHALFFSDLALRRIGAKILPDYKVVVFDEAHTLEDVAANHLGIQIGQGGVTYLLNKLYLATPRKTTGLLTCYHSDDAFRDWSAVRQAAEQFFADIEVWRQKTSGSGRVREPNIVANPLSEELRKLANSLSKIADGISSDEEKIEVKSAARLCGVHALAFQEWVEQQRDRQVYWIETQGPKKNLWLASAPIEVGLLLRQQLYSKTPSIIHTSATLSTGGHEGFQHVEERLGVENCDHVQLGSPFEFKKQVDLYLFKEMPDPATQSKAYETIVIAKIPEFVDKTQGRAFALFTSYSFMKRAIAELRDLLRQRGYTVFCQGETLAPNRLLESFRETPRAVLFGVDTFWHGVDVKGDALSNVIITKLPFTPPEQPLMEARQEAIADAGGIPFRDYQLPQAVLKLKQGFGRLIRTHTDRGIVVVFDPRVLMKRYGQAFLDALPECRVFVDGRETG